MQNEKGLTIFLNLLFTLYLACLPAASPFPVIFIKICQNTPQLCWGDEWPTLSWGERVRVRGK
jgi:hypothetical protein